MHGHPYDWTDAERFYRQAIALYPEGGVAYNNLAVISNFQGAYTATVYYYVRSAAVADAFPAVEKNLVLIFEKIHLMYKRLETDGTLGHAGSGSGGAARGMVKPKPQGMKKFLKELEPELSVRFARMYGELPLSLGCFRSCSGSQGARSLGFSVIEGEVSLVSSRRSSMVVMNKPCSEYNKSDPVSCGHGRRTH